MSDVIVRQRVSPQVHQYLQNYILAGEYPEGTRLIETEIAARLNVSRTPVREALVMLEGQDLITPLKRGGYVVGNIHQELMDILDIRIALETHAVRVAAERITPEEIGEFEKLCDAMERVPQDDMEQRAECNRWFHEALLEVACNRRLVKLVNHYQEYFMAAQPLFDTDDIHQTEREHRDIVTALNDHDVQRAVDLVRDHIWHAGETIRRAHEKNANGAGTNR